MLNLEKIGKEVRAIASLPNSDSTGVSLALDYEKSQFAEREGMKYALYLLKKKQWTAANSIIHKMIKKGIRISSLFHCRENLNLIKSGDSAPLEKLYSVTINKATLWDIGNILLRRPKQLLLIPEVRARLTRQRRVELVDKNSIRVAPGSDKIIQNAVVHNVDMLDMSNDDGGRPALLIKPLVAIDFVNCHKKTMDVLTIGPRSESEIFCLWSEGFSPERIKGLDLFSYSPLIDTGDAHLMPYPDDSFDIVVGGWILAYSNDPKLIAKEIVRVARNDAYVALGCAYSPIERIERLAKTTKIVSSEDKNIKATLFTEVSDITNYFKENLGLVYFQSPAERSRRSGTAALSCIFQVKK